MGSGAPGQARLAVCAEVVQANGALEGLLFCCCSRGHARNTPRYPNPSSPTPGVNEHEVDAFAALARARPIDVRFIEFMPFDDNDWSDSKLVRRAYTPPLPPRYPNPSSLPTMHRSHPPLPPRCPKPPSRYPKAPSPTPTVPEPTW